MNALYCQSCGMPLEQEAQFGMEENGAKNREYCVYCYENGKFTRPSCTMEQMIEICVPFMKDNGMPEAEARKLLETHLPHLKRWAARGH